MTIFCWLELFLWLASPFIVLILPIAIYRLVARHLHAQREKDEEQQRQRELKLQLLELSYSGSTLSNDQKHQLLTLPSDQIIPTARSYIEQLPGVTLGDETHQIGRYVFDEQTLSLPVRLPHKQRTRHLYIIGKTGSGKTTLLRNIIKQDLESGAGFAVIAPEQEMLTEEIIPMIPDNRRDDLIYINPMDDTRPVPFNPLKLAKGEDFDRRVDETFTIFGRIVGDTTPRMERILSNTFAALIELKESTLLDIERLLDPTDPTLRQRVCRITKDPLLREFFEKIYPTFPKDAHQPITNRVSKLIRPKRIRTFLCNPTHSLNFRKAMDTGKILLFNLSDGLLGETTASIIGELIISKLQSAAVSRADTPSAQRKRFYLYIDEFQTFTGVASRSYEVMLSRARKYEMGLVLAHQQTGQIPQPLLKEILGNVGTVVALQVGTDDARKLSREFLLPTADRYGSLEMKPPDPTALVQQPQGEAHAKIENKSFLLSCRPPPRVDLHRTKHLIAYSRTRWGRWAHDPAKVLQTRNEANDDEFTHTWDD